MVESPLCAFCNVEEESLEHLLYFCESSSFFWKELLSWIAVDANIVLNASLLDILFGKFDLEKDFLLVNHILLHAKYFIYKCKLLKVIPPLLVFKAKLKATYKLELHIAKEKGILLNYYKKWDNFLSWLSWCPTYLCKRNFFSLFLSRLYLCFTHNSHTDTQQQRHQKSSFVLECCNLDPRYLIFTLTQCSEWMFKCSLLIFFLLVFVVFCFSFLHCIVFLFFVLFCNYVFFMAKTT